MNHSVTKNDLEFRNQVESCEYHVDDFSHRAHLRLAYVYLAENDADTSVALMRHTLRSLLTHNGIEPGSKYHETLTKAWILAVHHFMHSSEDASAADEFIDNNPDMLNSRIMMTHYTAELLFSDDARREYLQPDLDPIPRH